MRMWRSVAWDLVLQQAEDELRGAAHVGIQTRGTEAFNTATACVQVGWLVTRVKRHDYDSERISETGTDVSFSTVMKRARRSCRETFSLMRTSKGSDSNAL